MTLPVSGLITGGQIADELGKPGQRITTNDTDFLQLAGKTAGQRVIIPDDLWGKSSVPAVTLSTTLLSKEASGNPLTSDPVSAIVTGRDPATLTYLWEYVSGSTGITCLNPTAQTTTFSGGSLNFFSTRDAFWRCKVTTPTGSVTYSDINVEVYFKRA